MPRRLLATWLLIVVAGCSRAAPVTDGGRAAAVRIDGDFGDWPADVQLQSDADYLYVRLDLPEERTLQASLPLVVAVDAAGDAAPGGAPVPVLEVVFSPERSDRQGVAVVVPAADGAAARPVPHAALDLVVAPTFASRTFELRIARRAPGLPELSGRLASGRVRVRATSRDAAGGVAWRGPVLETTLAGSAGAAPTPSIASVPPSPPGDGIRVVSWNVLLASPRKKPEPFARVLRALDPDVVLLQEWEGATADELVAWFTTHLPGSGGAPWHAVTSAGWGVAIVGRGAVAPLGPARIARPAGAPADPRRADAALRLVAARVATSLGPVCAASLHLKCCGDADGPEDAARRAEARLARDVLAAAFGEAEPCVRVLGGDLNLVGSDRPLEILRADLGAGGAALAVADTPVLADRATYTWFQPWSRFSPGRLDWLLHGAGAAAERAFVLDVRRLDAASLAQSGLAAADGDASDHLPIVLDLVRAPSG